MKHIIWLFIVGWMLVQSQPTSATASVHGWELRYVDGVMMAMWEQPRAAGRVESIVLARSGPDGGWEVQRWINLPAGPQTVVLPNHQPGTQYQLTILTTDPDRPVLGPVAVSDWIQSDWGVWLPLITH